jgi:DUF4097 and DUF4098 domain-containing protein YvlB
MHNNARLRPRATTALATAIIALGLCAVAAPAAWTQTETEHISRVVKLDAGGTLKLKTFSGRVTITGMDRQDVAIDAVRRAPRERLNRITLDIHTEGSTVVVEANHRDRSDWTDRDNVVETDFDIKVPARTNLDVTGFSSPIDVRGVEGSHNVHTFSSHLQLDDVTGPIKAHTFSGSVEIRAKGWKDQQTIDVDTFSGSIEVHLPDSARGTVTFNSFSGHLTSDLPLTLRTGGRRSIRATLSGGDSNGGLTLKTFSGNVRIDR